MKKDLRQIHLDHADICMDCESIFDARNQTTCPGCGSVSIHPVAKWIIPIKPTNTVRRVEKAA